MQADRKIVVLVFLYLVGFASCAWPVEHNYSLILAEYGEDSDGEQTQTLVRYQFENGALVAKESILTTRTLDLRYDLGRNQIYENRYLVTMWGDVVDLTTRQLLFKSKGTLLGIDQNSGSVVVRVERDEESGIYAFDLRTSHYGLLKETNPWSLPGTVSPNRQLSATGNAGEIWVHRPDGTKVLLGSEFWRSGSFECNELAKPTFVWTDDQHLLTLKGNGKVVLVDLQGKTEPVVTIPDDDPSGCGPELLRDSENQIYYRQEKFSWRIDVAKRSFEPYLLQPTGNGFDMEYQQNDSYGQIIHYEGKEIGRWWCVSPVTAPGRIAIAFGAVGSNLGYPAGVKVWSAETNEWSTIKPDWLTGIIGWVED